MNENTLIDKLSSLLIGEKKLVTYKSACSSLDIDCKQSKVLLKKLLDKSNEFEASWLISGIEKDSKILKYKFTTTDKLAATKARFLKVEEEHVYSLRAKSGETSQEVNGTEDISETHYKADMYVMQNVWLDRGNFMSDQILLDHRYCSIRGLSLGRTNVKRSKNLCSPDRKKKIVELRTDGDGERKSFPEKLKLGRNLKRGSSDADLPKKKRVKTSSIAGMFVKQKAKMESNQASSEKQAASKEGLMKSSTKTESEKPKAGGGKKKGLFGFFSKAKTTNPFDALKREKRNKVRSKPKIAKVKKVPTKRAVKKRSYEASKPKRPAPQKITQLPEVMDIFANESDDDEEEKSWERGLREQEEEDEEEMAKLQEAQMRKNRNKKSMLVDSDSETEMTEQKKDPSATTIANSMSALDSASEDEKPVKLSAKEKRALHKAEELKRKKVKLAKRKMNFWGAAKTKLKSKVRKKKKIKTITYIDPETQMLITQDVEVTDDEGVEAA